MSAATPLTAWLLAAAASPAGAEALTSYRFSRLDAVDDPRLFWSVAAAAVAALAAFVILMYRRENDALPRFAAAALATLRMTALAGACLFFLGPVKRTDEELTSESRVVVLVDSSQSMAVEDEPAGDAGRQSRSAAVRRALADPAFLARLSTQHEVTVASFDAEVRRVESRRRQTSRDELPASANLGPQDAATTAPGDDPLRPLGVETRLGEALAAVLAERSGGPLAAVIVVSDGGQNRGVDPLATSEAFAEARVPIATIGVGSTEPRRNVRLQELIAPARAYPGDPTTVRALVQSEGFAGQSVDVELYAREANQGAAAVRLDRRTVELNREGDAAQVEFTVEPGAVGRLELEARLVAPAEDQYADDDRRAADMEVVDANLRVLLVAGGATRDYRFLRNQLRRDAHATVDVWLQLAPEGISQDANAILPDFPRSKAELYKYDAIVAFDPDWTRLDAEQVDMLETWVAQEAGGMIVIAGPVNTAAWSQHADYAKIRGLYPVEFQRRLTLLDDGAFGSTTPWPLDFTREGAEADFLWLAATPEDSRAAWQRFPGVFGCYSVKGPKPGAQVYARYSDPEAGLSVERPVYLADHFYGAGRVLYLGSGEMWRLRAVDVGFFEKIYTQLLRHVSEGRLLRGSSLGRLLAERDRYFVGDLAVVRAQLSTAGREPYRAASVTARVSGPGAADATAGARYVELTADASRPGNFMGQFPVTREGSYRIELAVPDGPGEVLSQRITVAAPDLEFRETRRDEKLLTALATKTSGQYYPDLQLALNGAGGIKPVGDLAPSRAEVRIVHGKPEAAFSERVNRALLAVIAGALCLEWMLRRLLKLA